MKLDFIFVASLAFAAQSLTRDKDIPRFSETDQSILQARDEAAIQPVSHNGATPLFSQEIIAEFKIR